MYQRLKELRTLELTPQNEIAKIINIKQCSYSEYESEYTTIPLKHLITLCDYFDVSLDYIFNFTDIKNYKNSKKGFSKQISGKRLKEFRKEYALTQVKLANILNIVRTVITNYENGKHLIATPFLYDICKKYHISADYLLGKVDEPKYLK
ncbi:MAG: transcriptional regulator [Ruminococcus sp.]|nr:transcriptional regulator [Ruminococcus sp.]